MKLNAKKVFWTICIKYGKMQIKPTNESYLLKEEPFLFHIIWVKLGRVVFCMCEIYCFMNSHQYFRNLLLGPFPFRNVI
jgi:hypothetical protein